jgi:hypothetical protein
VRAIAQSETLDRRTPMAKKKATKKKKAKKRIAKKKPV